MEIVDDLGNDADVEDEDFEEEEEEAENGDAVRAAASSSMPGTPNHAAAAAGKEYASESEAVWIVGGRRRRNNNQQQQQQRHRTTSAQRRRENWVARAWDMRRSMMRDRNQNRNRRVPALEREEEQQEEEEEEEVGGRRRSWMRMDLEEVKACRDLGLGLPPAWTVELPYGLSGGETSSGGNSPSGSWRISSPGDDPREVKARLKAWAQAVVLASASHLQD
ncbi:hypothetical protein ACMD2_24943 [Ananas comosus]|uniref:Uncharacterized protein n=1 Tax=Ananas comosus TaxID=4615 RepID=A0A199V5X0_ANACO|nr:hypothetical protein ACMD2_24943 [Ananas comosus]